MFFVCWRDGDPFKDGNSIKIRNNFNLIKKIKVFIKIVNVFIKIKNVFNKVKNVFTELKNVFVKLLRFN